MNHDVLSAFLTCQVVSAVDCSALQDLLSQQQPHEAVLITTHPHFSYTPNRSLIGNIHCA